MRQETTDELITHETLLKIPYQWAAGEYTGEFLRELRDSGRIYANKCPKCHRFRCPPGPVCGVCHTRMAEREKWVEVGPKGTLLAFSVAEQSFLIPTTGDMLEVPFSVGVILLDGAPASLQHRLEETNPDKIKVGMRVEAVFKPKEQRQANIFDIMHFKAI
jgi:uncharacterized OB-fold protein